MFRFFTFVQDLKIHIGAVIAFLLLLLVKIKLVPPPEIANWWAVEFLASKNFEDVSSNILSSIVAAYAFYLVIEFFPAQKRMRDTKLILDNLLASIVLSYEDELGSYSSGTIYDHNLECLRQDYLDGLIAKIQEQADYSSLYSTALHAASILNALDQGAVLANTISPMHSMYWIKITAKARRLASMVKERPRGGLLIPEDVLYGDQSRHSHIKGYAKLYMKSTNHRDRMRGGYWPLIDEIRNWKGIGYSGK
ncbi:hypothetical protein D3C77_288260 [compost metagenome]